MSCTRTGDLAEGDARTDDRRWTRERYLGREAMVWCAVNVRVHRGIWDEILNT